MTGTQRRPVLSRRRELAGGSARSLLMTVLGEFVLHGWDLARASGQELRCAPEVAVAVYESAVAVGEQARSMGVYGPVVEVGADASPLERALGASGRDPGWSR